MTEDQELSFFISRYEANPQDYDAVAALVKAYRARNMVDEAIEMEQYLTTLTPPTRATARARQAAEKQDCVSWFGPVSFTCFIASLVNALIVAFGYSHMSWGEAIGLVLLHIIGGVLTLSPSMLAEWRDTKEKWQVFTVNVIFGGPFLGSIGLEVKPMLCIFALGWFGSLIWAFVAQKGPRSRW